VIKNCVCKKIESSRFQGYNINSYFYVIGVVHETKSLLKFVLFANEILPTVRFKGGILRNKLAMSKESQKMMPRKSRQTTITHTVSNIRVYTLWHPFPIALGVISKRKF
jgi:hypothetical protein